MRRLTIGCLFVLAAGVCPGLHAQQKPFVHPGMMQDRVDLEYMKQKVLAGEQPWKDAFDRLKAAVSAVRRPEPVSHISQGPYGAADMGGKALSDDASVAYDDALLWYITGDKAYAAKAIGILNAWSGTLWDFDDNNAKLLAGLTGYGLLNAAEILRYTHSGWTDKDIGQFKRLLLTVYYPLIKDFFPEANGNWDASMINTMLCIAVFCDDHTLFDRAVERFFRGPGNGGITKYIYPSGQIQEATRDWGHVQLGIGEFAKAAQVAWTQGVDFYGVAEGRLALGFEYTSKFMLGEDVPVYGVISTRKRDEFRDIYEFVYDHYHSVRGLEMPYTARVIEKTRPRSSVALLTGLRAPRADRSRADSGGEDLHRPPATAVVSGALREPTAIPPADAVRVTPGGSIQAALDAAAAHGGWVILSRGVFTLDSALRMRGGVTLSGEGNGTILFLAPAVRTRTMVNADNNMHDVVLRDFLIEGATSTSEGDDPNSNRRNRLYQNAPSREGVVFSATSTSRLTNIRLVHLTVQHFTKNGVSIRGGERISIDSCDFSDNGSSVVPGPGIHHNLHLTRVMDCTITGSRFDTSPWGSGIDLSLSRNVLISGNEAARNKLQGIRCTDSRDVRIKDNVLEGNDENGILADISADGNQDITVSNNISRNNGAHGISVQASGAQAANNTISDNGADKTNNIPGR